MHQSRYILTVLLVGLVALASIRSAEAQTDPAPFVIEIDEQIYFAPEFSTLQAIVGLTVCDSIDLSTEERTLVVGGPGTPAECNQAWRAITLEFVGNIAPLGNDVILMPGETVTVSGLTPYPSVLGSDLPPFWIEVRSNGQTITEADLADLQPLMAYVGGVNCGSSASPASEPTIVTVPVGAAGTPAVCREAGAEIVLVDGNDIRLAVRPSIGPGPYYQLNNLTPDPTQDSPPLPTILGNAGLATSGDTPPRIALLLAMLVTILGARRVTRPARR